MSRIQLIFFHLLDILTTIMKREEAKMETISPHFLRRFPSTVKEESMCPVIPKNDESFKVSSVRVNLRLLLGTITPLQSLVLVQRRKSNRKVQILSLNSKWA